MVSTRGVAQRDHGIIFADKEADNRIRIVESRIPGQKRLLGDWPRFSAKNARILLTAIQNPITANRTRWRSRGKVSEI